MLGWALIRPRRRTRGEAFSDAGKDAVSLALGAAPFLVIAGFIEAFVTPSDAIGPTAKLRIISRRVGWPSCGTPINL